MEITLQELVAAMKPASALPETSFEVGCKYFIRTATIYVTGCLKAITATDLLLSDAAWVPDTGRFHDALKNSVVNESEPYVNDVIVSRGGIIDATKWSGALPSSQK